MSLDRWSWRPSLLLLLLQLLLLLPTNKASSSQHHTSPLITFKHPLYNVTIPENTIGKVYVKQPPEEDSLGIQLSQHNKDIDIKFKIINGDKNKFFKAEERLVGDFCFLFIRLRTGNTDVLNRERKDKYSLEIKATASKKDGKNKVLFETGTTVLVKVLDTNDLNPLFYPTEYAVTVPEDTPLYSSVAKVSAEDADLGFNGEIYYSFLEATDQFAIDLSSGVVIITRPLSFTDRSYHELIVLGKDRGTLFQTGGSAHAARATLTIRVKQVNLHNPEIYVQSLPDLIEDSHSEIYAVVRVVDKDEGIHGQINKLEIVNGDPDGHFSVVKTDRATEFNIVAHALLDREKNPKGYNLTLRAMDRGIPPKQTYKSLSVLLVDVNDNAPVFHKEIYEVNVPESAPLNTPVIRLKVTDADLDRNAKVFLEIVGGNEGGEFHINPHTGMLYTAVILDAEAKSFYTLTVSAIDQGNIGTRKQSSAKVKINIIDTNDNDPLFEKPEMTVWLDENESAGTSVTKVTAKDRDSGENAYISYSIANLNPVPFEIDHFSGIIKTTNILDYESMRREYILRLRASDWGLPFRRQTEMQMTIKLKDVNDNRPQFEKIDCVGHVSKYIPISSEIFLLSAIDLDADSIITYTIISGNEENCFNLDSTSGSLTIGCDLRMLKSEEMYLNFTATDGTHFSDMMKMKIHLTSFKKPSYSTADGMFQCKDTGVARRFAEVAATSEKNNAQGRDVSKEEFAMMPSRYGENVHAPEFHGFPLEIKVNESVPLGTTLTRLKAKDRDLGYNGKLIFGISGGDPDSVLRIDPEIGDLKIIGYLDRERREKYYINVSVFDLGRPQKGVSRVLPITVLDVNDNAPKFTKTLSNYKILENALNGTIICKLNATDADGDEFSTIKYSLITDTKDFSVDKDSGILMVSSPLDREKQSLYELKIKAEDSGGLFSEALVRVSLEDVNDNPPKFSLSSFTIKVREDIPQGSFIAIISATDPDEGNGGKITYSILKNNDNEHTYFKIDPMTGTLRTTKLLDFEERQVHNVIVRASDSGIPVLFSDVNVLIEIIDVNENMFPPVFEDLVLEGSVLENKPIGTRVFVAKATDADPPGMDSRITYSIKGGDGLGYFSIDNNGMIRTLAILDAETKDHYWLTICAQDQAVIPLYSCVKVYIKVKDENDCIPLSNDSMYMSSVPENAVPGRALLQITSFDCDLTASAITYTMLSGDAAGLFNINHTTGILYTMGKLDREIQDEHSLEVEISDGFWTSTTRILIEVTDVNDHAPVFLEPYHTIRVPASTDLLKKINAIDSKMPEEKFKEDSNIDSENNAFEVFRVLAHDEDDGENGEITFSMKQTKGKFPFNINPKTGIVFSKIFLEGGNSYELNIRATDSSSVPKITTNRINVEVISIPKTSENPPIVTAPPTVKITESDKVGFLVAFIQAYDDDNETLWYSITEGDPNSEFYIGLETGNVLLAKRLSWENKKSYTLTISVTDGVHTVYTKLNILVINDINLEGPTFSQGLYVVNVSENFAGNGPILSLRATGGENLVYNIHNSQNSLSSGIFHMDMLSGDITVKSPLDRETIKEHLLTIMVQDQGIKSKKSFTRVLIRVFDYNDHPPEFSSKIIQGKVYETSPIGTKIVKVLASDKDKGENSVIIYSIASGNIGNIFSIDSKLGDISLSSDLNLNVVSEYMLQVKASNPGQNPLSATIPVHIMVTMADNAQPKFLKLSYSADVYENEPVNTIVDHIEARSTSSLTFIIKEGNTNDAFTINPSTGVVTTKFMLDFEEIQVYNLTILATNMGGISASVSLIIHVLDKNDNAPRFLKTSYEGNILESAPISSHVFSNASTRVILLTEDLDSGSNGLKSYDIVEPEAKQNFYIDPTTGAVKTLKTLDYETQKKYKFHVSVFDQGKPKLVSDILAEVNINVLDVNDCAPKFEHSEYNASVLLPTFKNIAVITLIATDADSKANTLLKYDIIDGDKKNVFAIDPVMGTITVLQPDKVKHSHKLLVRVSDGKYSNIAQIHVNVAKSENSTIKFQKPYYEGNVMENSTKIVTVAVVNVLGNQLNDHIQFSILNPTDMFAIGLTSGAIQTLGVKFDREIKDNYVLIVEAKTTKSTNNLSITHTVVNVTVMDVNDNCPIFVNLPYYAVVSVDDPKGHVITKVHAIDLDSLENGEVRYEMKRGHGELFKVCRKTGEVSLKQSLEGHNKEYHLIIGAYDGGLTPCYSETTVSVKVVDRSMPVFDKQFYSVVVKENIETLTPLGLPLQASSPLGRKLIYSIVSGNEKEKFVLDFNTGILFAAEELDFEEQPLHQLRVRATDGFTGIYAEVDVSIIVDDVNDCPPEFSADSYHVSVSESAPFGTLIMKLEAFDNDTGINKEISYIMVQSTGNSSQYFHMDSIDGSIYLKQSLDRETIPQHHFTVIARDKGLPALSSTVHVWVKVLDMNDNPPYIEQLLYNAVLSEHAQRGQIVAKVTASDLDEASDLSYTIVGGNEKQVFSINNTNGIIQVINIDKINNKHSTIILNVSVSDGVYTAFTRVKIALQSANVYSPKFTQSVYEAKILENQPPSTFIVKVEAFDDDFGEYGIVSYSIVSNSLKEIFSIDNNTGEIQTLVKLDREQKSEYDLVIMASDIGGRPAFTTVQIKIKDENDNFPVFLYQEYKISVPYNHTNTKPFIQAIATDKDEDLNSKIEYSIYDLQNSGVNDVFSINNANGEISLQENAATWESQVFQFWIRATDKGSPPKHADTSIEIYIMSATDLAPKFEKLYEKFFIVENSPQGSIITRLKMTSNIPTKFRILPAAYDSSLFMIDNQGQLVLSKSIDRENINTFNIGIIAETETSPSISAFTEITLNILDENDNAPFFHSSPVFLNLAENIEQGTTIMKVTADDDDTGSNGEVRYSLGGDSSSIGNVFAIDPYKGWITTLIKFDRETQPVYKFQVIATDNAYQKHITRNTMIVHLKDYNDCPPVFTKKIYKASVKEDVQPGTVVANLEITDEDADVAPVEYYVISGDENCQFNIRSTGQLYTTKSLDREIIPVYNLGVIVTDGKFVAHTIVSVDIIDINDNPPYCLRHRYHHTVSEGVPIATPIVTVIATDADQDQNAKLRFYLSGFKSEHFSIDKITGEVVTAATLDREQHWKYNLVAHVQDKEKTSWECSSEINIEVLDVNDNSPQFSTNRYSISVPEDVEIGTLIMKVHASDKDKGVNRIVRYNLVDDLMGQFTITEDTGIITLLAPLDRETKSLFNLEVRATDLGKPPLWNQVAIQLTVSDVNDNPPEFGTRNYFALIPEIDPVGTEIIRVLATSKDTGVNADIFYSIVDGNEHKKFTIGYKTGLISLAAPLDYEKSKEYILTVQAQDRGVPPLNNLATVNISITDSNDNPPVFTQSVYNAEIREDAKISDLVIQIIANDADSGANGRITYSIENGNKARKFAINGISGKVTLISTLDRESESFYSLGIRATDNGIPMLMSTTILNIEVTDANDNPPKFSQKNYTGILQENKPIGYTIIEFSIFDDDISPNTSPYTFEIKSGNEDSSFILEQDGLLKTTRKFNHHTKNLYLLHIRVFDNGSPPLYSDTWATIRIIEESKYQPVITPLEIYINSHTDEFPKNKIGRVFAFDQDPFDKLSYSLIFPYANVTTQSDLFSIDEKNGTLYTKSPIDIGKYQLNVSVTDGKFVSFSIVKIYMELVTKEMLKNAVVIRFRDVSPMPFVKNHRKGFLRALRNAMNCHVEDIVIINIQPSIEDSNMINNKEKRSNSFAVDYLSRIARSPRQSIKDLDVLFSVKKINPQGAVSFHSPDTIRKSLSINLEEMEESSKLIVEQMMRVKCSSHYCAYGECQEKFLSEKLKINLIMSEVTSLVGPKYEHIAECKCHDGYGGERCETIVNECARKPCPENEKCYPDKSIQGYKCQCADKFEESKCHIDTTKCTTGMCIKPNNPVFFGGKSYAQYRIIGKDMLNGKRFFEDFLNLSFKIRTIHPSGNLFYAAGKIDYNILEIMNGILQYRLELGSGEGIVRVTSVKVSDGKWHEIRLERDGSSIHLTVDGKYVAQGSAPGMNGILNLYTDDLFVGAEVRQHPSILGFEDIRRGYVGCIGDIKVSNEVIPLHNGGTGSVLTLKRLANIEFNCPAILESPGPCGNLPCLHGGTCTNNVRAVQIEDKSDYECACHERFVGKNCEIDTNPCASQPCLYGGICIPLPEGDFECTCNKGLHGKRCELGKWCENENTCLHGGICEEGDTGPTCRCHGYRGNLCEFDVDECKGDPCLNGATCINEPGSFRCVCPPDKTGMHCGNPLHSNAVTSDVYEFIGNNRIFWLIGILIGTIIIVFIISLLIGCYKKQYSSNDREEKPNILKSNLKQDIQVAKMGRSKLSNLEVQCSVVSSPSERSNSYTPIPTVLHDGHNILNNMDRLRNYGSAGDELESLPHDYIKNLNNENTSHRADSGQINKVKWADQVQIQSYTDIKIQNNLGGNNIKNPGENIITPPRDYHWDCSDWCNNVGIGGPLSDIIEVPGSSIADSSSCKSSEEYSHIQNKSLQSCSNVDEEFTENEFRDENYAVHPNKYLPCFTYSSTEAETAAEDDDNHNDEPVIEPYGFPSARRRQNHSDNELGSIVSLLEERSSLLSQPNKSNTSINICAIEDSENEHNEKWKLDSIHHTEV